MLIRDMTENALSIRRKSVDDEEKELYASVAARSMQAHEILKELPQEKQSILIDYFEKTNMIADHECLHLYVQGAKDCVELLKKLGVF